MLRQMEYHAGIDLDGLIEVSKSAESFFDKPLHGQMKKADLFPEVVASSAT